jgi:hypothetical protein
VGTQSLSRHGIEEKNSHPLPGIEPRSSDYPARSQSLYRLEKKKHYFFSALRQLQNMLRDPSDYLFPFTGVIMSGCYIILKAITPYLCVIKQMISVQSIFRHSSL